MVRRCAERGLTLLELVVATAILSAVVTAGIASLRAARESLVGDAEYLEVQPVLERWWSVRAHQTSQEDAPPPWEWVSDDGAKWRVHIERMEPNIPSESTDTEHAESFMLDLQWARVMVERMDALGAAQPVCVRPMLVPALSTKAPESGSVR